MRDKNKNKHCVMCNLVIAAQEVNDFFYLNAKRYIAATKRRHKEGTDYRR